MAEIDFSKFEKVLGSIEKQLVMQSSFLESIYYLQSAQVESDKERMEDTARMQQLIALRERNAPSIDDRYEDLNDSSQQPKPTPADESKISTGIAGLIGMVLGKLSISNIASMLLKGGIALAIAKPLGDFVTGAVSEALDQMGADPAIAAAFGDAFGGAVEWATIGSIFGKKYALLFGLGGALGETIGNLIGASEDKIFEAFGMAFSQQDLINYGSILGTVFGPKLLMSALGDTVIDNVGDVTKATLKGGLRASFIEGFSLKKLGKGAGWGALVAGVGNLLAIGITSMTGSKELGDVMSWGSSAAGIGLTIGSIFGPEGALIGAIAGFAIGAGASLIGWMQEQSDAQAQQIKARTEQSLSSADEAIKAGRYDVAKSILESADESIAQLSIGNTAEDAAKYLTRLDALRSEVAKGIGGAEGAAVLSAGEDSTRLTRINLEERRAAASPGGILPEESDKRLASAKTAISDYINYAYKDTSGMDYNISLSDVQLATQNEMSGMSPEAQRIAQDFMASELKKKFGIVEATKDQLVSGYTEYMKSRLKALDNTAMPNTGGTGSVNFAPVNVGGSTSSSATYHYTTITSNPYTSLDAPFLP